jgi:hypothetical protein
MICDQGEHVEDELKRLATLYGSMTDEELEELAKDRKSLTETAKQAIQSELAKRKLTVEEEIPRATDEHLELVTVREYRDLPQALVAKGVLDSAGIPCFLSDENIIRMDWMWSNLMGGVKLRVRKEDASEAAELIQQDFSASQDTDATQEPL